MPDIDELAALAAVADAQERNPINAINDIKHAIEDIRKTVQKIQIQGDKLGDYAYRWIIIILLAIIAYRIH